MLIYLIDTVERAMGNISGLLSAEDFFLSWILFLSEFIISLYFLP